MKKSALIIMMSGAIGLAGCAYTDEYGGYGYDGRYSTSGHYGSNYYGQGGPNFAETAAEACTYQARRYGRANVGTVQQLNGSTMRVYGTIDMNRSYERRPFACNYRSDGRITDFDID